MAPFGPPKPLHQERAFKRLSGQTRFGAWKCTEGAAAVREVVWGLSYRRARALGFIFRLPRADDGGPATLTLGPPIGPWHFFRAERAEKMVP